MQPRMALASRAIGSPLQRCPKLGSLWRGILIKSAIGGRPAEVNVLV